MIKLTKSDMADEKTTNPITKSRSVEHSGEFIGSRQDVTSSTSSEVQGTPRPIKKTS